MDCRLITEADVMPRACRFECEPFGRKRMIEPETRENLIKRALETMEEASDSMPEVFVTLFEGEMAREKGGSC